MSEPGVNAVPKTIEDQNCRTRYRT